MITGFSTTDLDGNAVDSSILSEAKLTVLNVWATYCTPCVNEMPDLETLSQNYKDRGVQVVGLVADVFDDEEKKAEAKEILSATGVTYVNLLPDTVLDDSLLYDITGTPTTLFLDSEGKILKIVEGTRDLDALTEMVDELLGEQSFSLKEAVINMINGEEPISKEAVRGVLYSFFFSGLKNEKTLFFLDFKLKPSYNHIVNPILSFDFCYHRR